MASVIFAVIVLVAVSVYAADPTTDPLSICRPLFQMLQVNPMTGPRLRRNLADDAVVALDGGNVQVPRLDGRNLAAMAMDDEMRPMLVNASKADMLAKSRRIEEGVDQSFRTGVINEAAQVYDVINIGAGPQEFIFQNGLNDVVANAGKNKLKTLTIENTDVVASTFDGGWWDLNSTTRKSKKGLPLPGQGNLNELKGSPLQLPQVSREAFTRASNLADVVQISRNTLDDSPVLLNHVAMKPMRAPAGSPAKYMIDAMGRDGVTRRFYANVIVDSSGIGVEEISFNSPSSKILSDTIRARRKIEDYPGIMTFSELKAGVDTKARPFREFVDQDILVVGPKDGGRTVNEFLFRQSPGSAYKVDMTQVGDVRSVQWAGLTAEDCTDFIVNTRVRYAKLAGPIKSGKLQGIPARLVDIEQEASGKIKPIYEEIVFPKMTDGPNPTIKKPLDPKKVLANIQKRNPVAKIIVADASPRADGTVVVKYSGKPVDRIIFTAGYKNNADNFYSNIVGETTGDAAAFFTSDAVDTVTGRVFEAGDKVVPIARRIKGENIFLIGPRAPGLISKEELAGVSDNVVSIYANGPRSYELGRQLADNLPRGKFPKLQKPAREPLKTTLFSGSLDPEERFFAASPSRPIPELKASSDSFLMARMGHLLNQFELPAGKSLNLSFVRQGRGVELVFETSISKFQQQTIIDSLRKDPDMIAWINAYIGDGQVRDRLAFRFVGDARGDLDLVASDMKVMLRKVDQDVIKSTAAPRARAPFGSGTGTAIPAAEIDSARTAIEGLALNSSTQNQLYDLAISGKLSQQQLALIVSEAERANAAIVQIRAVPSKRNLLAGIDPRDKYASQFPDSEIEQRINALIGPQPAGNDPMGAVRLTLREILRRPYLEDLQVGIRERSRSSGAVGTGDALLKRVLPRTEGPIEVNPGFSNFTQGAQGRILSDLEAQLRFLGFSEAEAGNIAGSFTTEVRSAISNKDLESALQLYAQKTGTSLENARTNLAAIQERLDNARKLRDSDPDLDFSKSDFGIERLQERAAPVIVEPLSPEELARVRELRTRGNTATAVRPRASTTRDVVLAGEFLSQAYKRNLKRLGISEAASQQASISGFASGRIGEAGNRRAVAEFAELFGLDETKASAELKNLRDEITGELNSRRLGTSSNPSAAVEAALNSESSLVARAPRPVLTEEQRAIALQNFQGQPGFSPRRVSALLSPRTTAREKRDIYNIALAEYADANKITDQVARERLRASGIVPPSAVATVEELSAVIADAASTARDVRNGVSEIIPNARLDTQLQLLGSAGTGTSLTSIRNAAVRAGESPADAFKRILLNVGVNEDTARYFTRISFAGTSIPATFAANADQELSVLLGVSKEEARGSVVGMKYLVTGTEVLPNGKGIAPEVFEKGKKLVDRARSLELKRREGSLTSGNLKTSERLINNLGLTSIEAQAATEFTEKAISDAFDVTSKIIGERGNYIRDLRIQADLAGAASTNFTAEERRELRNQFLLRLVRDGKATRDEANVILDGIPEFNPRLIERVAEARVAPATSAASTAAGQNFIDRIARNFSVDAAAAERISERIAIENNSVAKILGNLSREEAAVVRAIRQQADSDAAVQVNQTNRKRLRANYLRRLIDEAELPEADANQILESIPEFNSSLNLTSTDFEMETIETALVPDETTFLAEALEEVSEFVAKVDEELDKAYEAIAEAALQNNRAPASVVKVSKKSVVTRAKSQPYTAQIVATNQQKSKVKSPAWIAASVLSIDQLGDSLSPEAQIDAKKSACGLSTSSFENLCGCTGGKVDNVEFQCTCDGDAYNPYAGVCHKTLSARVRKDRELMLVLPRGLVRGPAHE